PAPPTAPPAPTARELAARFARLFARRAGRAALGARARFAGGRFLVLACALVVSVDFVASVAGSRDLVVFHGRSVLLVVIHIGIAGRLVVSLENARFSQRGGARFGRKPGVQRLVRFG